MPEFGATSKKRLKTCHPILQKIFTVVIEEYGCTVMSGYRGEVEQNTLYALGYSKLKYPLSYHNNANEEDKSESLAVDAAPDNGLWEATEKQWFMFAGIVKGVAKALGYKITWGGDWNNNYIFNDQKFIDYAHFQLEL